MASFLPVACVLKNRAKNISLVFFTHTIFSGKKTQIDEFVDCVEEFCSVDTDWDDDDRRICPLKFCNPFQTGMDHE